MPTAPRLMYASEFDRSGYAVAGRRYLKALAAVGTPVAWRPLLNNDINGRIPTDKSDLAPLWMQHLPAEACADAPTIWHSMPMSWAEVREQYPQGTFIGQTVWEADPIPQRWHAELAPADEIWVPTEWNADVMRRSGITRPVHVVPHPVDFAAPEPPPCSIPSDRTVFLNISAWEWRKRPDLALHAYLQAFTASDPVVLIVKTGPRTVSWHTRSSTETHTWWQVMNIVRQYPQPAEVVLITDTWSDSQIAGLIAAADCFVSLTAVEGWGLGAFDAAAAGKPVIITGYGGQLEWLGTGCPGLVPFTMVPVDHPDQSMFEAGMQWALADTRAAAEMMREFVDGSGSLRAWASNAAGRLREQYSLKRVGKQMTELTT